MSSEDEVIITRFEYQTLVGYITEEDGSLTKIFEGKALLADGSSRIMYGVLKRDDIMIKWNYSKNQKKPKIDRDPLGIKVKD